MDPFFFSLVVGFLVSSALVTILYLYMMSLRRELGKKLREGPKGKTLVLSHRDIGPIIGTDLVVEFEKIPEDVEQDNAKSDEKA